MRLRLPFALLATLLLTASAAGAADAAKKKPKPSIKAMGISVNRVFVPKSAGPVKADDGTNDCYIIGGGSSGVPSSLVAYLYVHTNRVPANAPLKMEIKTPWSEKFSAPTDSLFEGPFKSGLFKAFGKSQAIAYAGPTTKNDHFTYRMLPQPSPTSLYINGIYSISVSVKVGGKTLRSSARAEIAC